MKTRRFHVEIRAHDVPVDFEFNGKDELELALEGLYEDFDKSDIKATRDGDDIVVSATVIAKDTGKVTDANRAMMFGTTYVPYISYGIPIPVYKVTITAAEIEQG